MRGRTARKQKNDKKKKSPRTHEEGAWSRKRAPESYPLQGNPTGSDVYGGGGATKDGTNRTMDRDGEMKTRGTGGKNWRTGEVTKEETKMNEERGRLCRRVKVVIVCCGVEAFYIYIIKGWNISSWDAFSDTPRHRDKAADVTFDPKWRFIFNRSVLGLNRFDSQLMILN